MSKLAVIGTVEIPPEKRDQVLHLLMAHRGRCLRDEPGTLQFEVMIPREDNSKLHIYEVYESDAAFAVHRESASIAQWLRDTDGMGVKVVATRCTPAQ
jgi:(4S)-4-hydroxy-5-phosphonooxypentane-2,3-dione isomerase